jgi:hypothetical protein
VAPKLTPSFGRLAFARKSAREFGAGLAADTWIGREVVCIVMSGSTVIG